MNYFSALIAGATKYFKANGAGTTANPWVPHHVLTGFTGYPVFSGIFGELQAEGFQTEIANVFDTGVKNGQVNGTTQVLTGDGAITDTAGCAVLSSTTGTALLQTRNRLTYLAGHTAKAMFTASFSGAGTGYAGIFDTQDGAFIKVVNGVLSVVRRKATVEAEVAAGAFNGDSLVGLALDKLNIFIITFGYLGVGNISFWVLDSDGQPLKIHEFKTINALTSTHLRSPALPISLYTSGAMSLSSGSLSAGSMGDGARMGSSPFSGAHSASVGSGATVVLANYQSVTSFEYRAGVSTTNKKKARLLRVKFYVDTPATGEGTIEFTIDRVSSLSGASPANVSQYQSVMQYDTAGTPTLAGNVLTDYVGYYGGGGSDGASASGDNLDAISLGLVAYPGDIFTIRAKNLATTTVTARVALNWDER